MRINLRGRNVGVAEDGLHGPEIGAIFHHVRCAGVPKHVRAGVASRNETGLRDQLPQALTGQATASGDQE